MSERTGIDWLSIRQEILREGMKIDAEMKCGGVIATWEAAAQVALSRAESAITEGDVDALAEKVRTQMWESPAAYDYTGGVDDLAHLVKSLIRSRQSGAITEGDDWWGDPFGYWHPNQQPESILPCGIYIRLRFEHDTGYAYNLLDIVIEEESISTSDIEEPWIGPFPSWIFRSRQSGAITEGDVDSVAKEIAKALPEVTDLYSRINPILRRALRSRQSGEQTAGELLKADPRPKGWFWYARQQEQVAIGADRQWYDAHGQVNVIPSNDVLISLPPFTEDTNQHGESDE